ncbi:KH domain-containing protein [Haloplasma contractile]|uniref:RNA-binding protein KhpA n=1 Tax=Haloplasma contractile SSD-17B TaxID=1033810 RepID=U2DZ37_9MOLU|nr:KH domain-containing protein [Haloplasma contractile]ERJ13492.1 RNA-binding protein [Haloplasma contractile SSD-17B]
MDMEKLIATILEPLVDHKDDLVVKELPEDAEGFTIYEVLVNQEDVGRVIGKRGRIAQAVRSICYAAATKEGKKIRINIDHF